MSEKLTTHHLERRALIYVRQSSHQQLLHDQESRRQQYEMEQRVRDLGWQESDVIDDDQGCSAATAAGRSWFERMVAEVCLGKVRAVAAIEFSRYNREWHLMIENLGYHRVFPLNGRFQGPRLRDKRVRGCPLLHGPCEPAGPISLSVLRHRISAIVWAAEIARAPMPII